MTDKHLTSAPVTDLLNKLDSAKRFLRDIYEHTDCHGTDHTDAKMIRSTQAEIADIRRELTRLARR